MRREYPCIDSALFGSFGPIDTRGVGHEALVILSRRTAGPRSVRQNDVTL